MRWQAVIEAAEVQDLGSGDVEVVQALAHVGVGQVARLDVAQLRGGLGALELDHGAEVIDVAIE